MNKSKENTLKYMHKVIITSRIEMLKLQNFGHMTPSYKSKPMLTDV